MDIETFIYNCDENFELSDWFNDLWYPIYENKEILITNKVLLFLFNKNEKTKITCQYKQDLLSIQVLYDKILVDHNIEFNFVKTSQELYKQYPHISSKDNHTILKLSPMEFKKSLAYLPDPYAREEFYMMEEIMKDFKKYILDEEIKDLKKRIIQIIDLYMYVGNKITNLQNGCPVLEKMLNKLDINK